MRYLVLGDVHANLPALDAVLAAEPEWDEVIFVGDAIDFGPHPNEVVDRLSDLGGTFIRGNHDRELRAAGHSDPPRNRKNWTHWTRTELSDSNRDVLSEWGETAVVSTARGDVRFHHGDFDDSFDSIDVDPGIGPQTDPETLAVVGGLFEESTIVFGHRHEQFERSVDGTRFVNTGSVGRSNLSGLSAQYVVLDEGEILLRETDYDAEPTIAAMEALPIDETPTMWRRCLRRELFRLRRELGEPPDAGDIAARSRYDPVDYSDEFRSVRSALEDSRLVPLDRD